MNVENRKLFANRDARKRLSEMGGIMASSGELMNEVQQFADGREVTVEQYVAVIPGINNNRPIRLRGDTLERLQDLAPNIMQQAFVMDSATAKDRGLDVMRLRPGDAFVERELAKEVVPPSAMTSAPNMQAPVSDQGPSISAISPIEQGESPLNNLEFLRRGSTIENVPTIDAPVDTPKPEVPIGTLSGSNFITDPDQGYPFPTDVSVSPTRDNRSGLERLEAELEADPENIRAQVVRLGQSGKRAAEIANALGRPIQEILDIGLGVAADGTVGLGALAADLISVVQGAIVNNPESAEFYAGIAQNLRKFGDESYYGEGDILPRISNTDLLRGDPGLSEAEQLAQQREQIRKDSLAATLDGDDSLFAEGAPVEFLPEGATAAFPRTTSVTSVEGSMTAPEMAQSDLPEINLTPSPIKTMSGSGLTLPAPPQGRVGDMPIEELIDFRSPEAVLESEAILRNKEEAAAMENEMDDVLDPIVPSNTEGGRATAMGTETQAQTEALDALVADSPLQKDAQAVIAEAARKTDVTPDPSQGDDIAPSVVSSDAFYRELMLQPQGPETVRPKARPENGASGAQPDLGALEKTANNPDLSPEQKSSKLSNQLFSDMTGQKVSMSSKDSVKAYERLFSEMLGMDDKDAEKEMWHNMAMIGFAIAAGESPSALQNIANGMLAGTKMMKEDRATRQKREDAVKTMAIERSFKLEDDAAKFVRDLQLARVRGEGKDTYTDNRLRQILIGNITKNPDLFPGVLSEDGTPDPAKVQTYVDTFLTEGGLDDQLGGGGDSGKSHQELNNEAKEAGLTVYTGPDGKQYKVQ